MAFGTYSAAGADAGGYLSQADLLASGRLIRDEPLARQVGWPDATWAFSPLGSRPGPNVGEIVPNYPPGFPLTLAAARRLGGELAPFLVVPLLGALAVLCTYALGARLHTGTAGVIAAALLATSPIFLFQVVQPMSDVPATAWWTLATLVALAPFPGSALAAGATAGFALLARPNLLPLAVAVALMAMGWPRPSRTRSLWAFAAGITPAMGALALLQWRLYGSPFASGHGAFRDFFALANIGPNVLDYGLRLFRGETPALCVMVLALAVALPVRRRAAQIARGGAVTSGALAALVGAALLVCYLPYGVFPDWSYLRFLLPVFPLAFVAVGARLTGATMRLPRPARGLVLLATIAIACSVNITIAAREQAFNLRRYEARYRDAGRYLEAMLPPSAVVFAVQESASAHHYARTPIVRWDLLNVDLDTAVAALTALGRTPVLLVEDFEAADLRARFPASAIARLDWQPRADFGTETRVRLLDPADRDNPPRPLSTDRVR